MNHVLYDHLGEFVMIYLDNVIIYFKSMTEHIKHLDWVLGQLKWAGLKIKVEKCEFAKSEIKLLGYRISAEGTIPDLGKVTAIETLEWPTTISKLKGFLGAVGFFKKYIQGFGQIVKLLNDMTSIKFENCWTSEMDEAWKELKKWLTKALILRHPDFTKPFILYMNASKKGVDAILAQYYKEAKADYVVKYFSWSLRQAQENWSATDLECLTIVEAVRHFDEYLRERPFTVYMDHQALVTLRM